MCPILIYRSTLKDTLVYLNFLSRTLDINKGTTIKEINTMLIKINPGCEEILGSCRYAVNDEFINENITLSDNEHLYILPPSSGG